MKKTKTLGRQINLMYQDGRLQEHDQILAIDGQPLDISHQEAIRILQSAQGLVDLVIARGPLPELEEDPPEIDEGRLEVVNVEENLNSPNNYLAEKSLDEDGVEKSADMVVCIIIVNVICNYSSASKAKD
ncbi:hypothetical protein LOTGIDRAFT_152342 [Lottia gigantea]|uniref:PDZ domain-containing protein n=1 Tax=Lottia gigantea TaxID=225164 RepID=V4AMS6_LOTGI|nr:hypothetical protein LOTGIDRAFT_152342 [Lottia gigantea]ESP05484.1 hypothetical protein LOTGIDRAFT_152342 [Lottia gigantea]